MGNGKGWFRTPGRDGDRTLDEQMIGLEPLVAEIRGKRVLDFGCAEGLIGMELLNRGAAAVTGIDSIEDHIQVGKRIALDEGLDIELLVGNLNDYSLDNFAVVDVVLLLAILHKLQDPSAFAARAAALAQDLVVVRLPPAGAVIRDARSGFKAHDIAAVLRDAGLALESEVRGTNDEWIGYFRRPRATIELVPPPAPSEPAKPPAPAELPPAEPVVEKVVEEPSDAHKRSPSGDPINGDLGGAPTETAVQAEQTTSTEAAEAAADGDAAEASDESTESEPVSTETVAGRRRRGKRTGE